MFSSTSKTLEDLFIECSDVGNIVCSRLDSRSRASLGMVSQSLNAHSQSSKKYFQIVKLSMLLNKRTIDTNDLQLDYFRTNELEMLELASESAYNDDAARESLLVKAGSADVMQNADRDSFWMLLLKLIVKDFSADISFKDKDHTITVNTENRLAIQKFILFLLANKSFFLKTNQIDVSDGVIHLSGELIDISTLKVTDLKQFRKKMNEYRMQDSQDSNQWLYQVISNSLVQKKKKLSDDEKAWITAVINQKNSDIAVQLKWQKLIETIWPHNKRLAKSFVEALQTVDGDALKLVALVTETINHSTHEMALHLLVTACELSGEAIKTTLTIFKSEGFKRTEFFKFAADHLEGKLWSIWDNRRANIFDILDALKDEAVKMRLELLSGITENEYFNLALALFYAKRSNKSRLDLADVTERINFYTKKLLGHYSPVNVWSLLIYMLEENKNISNIKATLENYLEKYGQIERLKRDTTSGFSRLERSQLRISKIASSSVPEKIVKFIDFIMMHSKLFSYVKFQTIFTKYFGTPQFDKKAEKFLSSGGGIKPVDDYTPAALTCVVTPIAPEPPVALSSVSAPITFAPPDSPWVSGFFADEDPLQYPSEPPDFMQLDNEPQTIEELLNPQLFENEPNSSTAAAPWPVLFSQNNNQSASRGGMKRARENSVSSDSEELQPTSPKKKSR